MIITPGSLDIELASIDSMKTPPLRLWKTLKNKDSPFAFQNPRKKIPKKGEDWPKKKDHHEKESKTNAKPQVFFFFLKKKKKKLKTF